MSAARRPRRMWSAFELELLELYYADTPTGELAQLLDRPLERVYGKAISMGLRKSDEYMASPHACRLRRGDEVGKAYRFPKGHVPANKGLRRPGYSPGNMARTQFKKGRPAHETHNYRPIGTVKVNADGYLARKVTDDPSIVPVRRWETVHRLVWIAAHGPVPAGHCIVFKPGTRTTVLERITLDILECITQAENLRRNRQSPELAEIARLRGLLTRVIRRRENRESPQP